MTFHWKLAEHGPLDLTGAGVGFIVDGSGLPANEARLQLDQRHEIDLSGGRCRVLDKRG